MKIFGQIIRTAVNLTTLPVAVARDAFTLGGLDREDGRLHTTEHIERIKREAEEAPDAR